MTGLVIWVIGILGGATTLLSLFLWRQRTELQKARLAALKAETQNKQENDARILANAHLLTMSAEADYEKAISDLPANHISPAPGGSGKLPK